MPFCKPSVIGHVPDHVPTPSFHDLTIIRSSFAPFRCLTTCESSENRADDVRDLQLSHVLKEHLLGFAAACMNTATDMQMQSCCHEVVRSAIHDIAAFKMCALFLLKMDCRRDDEKRTFGTVIAGELWLLLFV